MFSKSFKNVCLCVCVWLTESLSKWQEWFNLGVVIKSGCSFLLCIISVFPKLPLIETYCSYVPKEVTYADSHWCYYYASCSPVRCEVFPAGTHLSRARFAHWPLAWVWQRRLFPGRIPSVHSTTRCKEKQGIPKARGGLQGTRGPHLVGVQGERTVRGLLWHFSPLSETSPKRNWELGIIRPWRRLNVQHFQKEFIIFF